MAAIYKNTLLILFFMLISTFVYAAVPQNISYQGILQNASGTPVSGTVSMTFSLYSSATGGNSLWSESQPNVAVTNPYGLTRPARSAQSNVQEARPIGMEFYI